MAPGGIPTERRSLSGHRLRDIAYEELPPSESFILLFEALNWAATIADRLGFGEKPNLLRALEYARNAVHHDWLLALTLTPRRFGEGAFGEGYFGGSVWRWKPSEQLVPDRADRDREPLYRTLLVDRSALDTLRALEELLPEHAAGPNPKRPLGDEPSPS
jgi:hypothetical protein